MIEKEEITSTEFPEVGNTTSTKGPPASQQGGLSVCVSVNSFTKKITERICMKFGVWFRHGVRKKRLTFGGDPDLDSTACFLFSTF